MGFSTSVYRIESAIYAKYILANYPDGKVAVLFPNDDYGRDIYSGFKDALGAKARTTIIAEASYDSSEPTIDSQIGKLKASGADIFVNFSTPRFGALAIRKVAELGWKPVHFINTTASSISTVFKPAGLENATGLITAQSIKEPGDPRYADDPGVKEYLDFMKQYNPDGEIANGQNAYGFLAAQVLQKVLEQCGADLSRDNIMTHSRKWASSSSPLTLRSLGSSAYWRILVTPTCTQTLNIDFLFPDSGVIVAYRWQLPHLTSNEAYQMGLRPWACRYIMSCSAPSCR